MDMHNDIQEILISGEELDQITTRLAAEISRDYTGKKLLLLGTLKGSVIFMADLMKKLTVPSQIDFVKVSSYGDGTKSSGTLNISLDLIRDDMDTLDILVIEDIVDSGRTLSALTERLRARGAKSVKACTMLDKPSRREFPFDPDYVGVVIPDAFVVGYGLDYAEDYRTLPYVGILKKEIYN